MNVPIASKSRDSILRRLRDCRLSSVDLPNDRIEAIQFEDPVRQFRQVVESVGGKVVEADAGQTWQDAVAQLSVVADHQRICSSHPGLSQANIEVNQVENPHALHDLDVLVAVGEFGVAENGAIWVTDREFQPRVAYFICQHLVLVLNRCQVVHNLHEAYSRLTWGAS
ncbi:MAG: LUD domain-containing protein, partial [Planctomycetota bacterium]|nr:LUD domain-containing protein [Planctomycetota bacterium]